MNSEWGAAAIGVLVTAFFGGLGILLVRVWKTRAGVRASDRTIDRTDWLTLFAQQAEALKSAESRIMAAEERGAKTEERESLCNERLIEVERKAARLEYIETYLSNHDPNFHPRRNSQVPKQ